VLLVLKGFGGCDVVWGFYTVSLLKLLLSIAIASLVGYVTNVIAVTLLFHPKKPYSIGPFKIHIGAGQEITVQRVDDLSRYTPPFLGKSHYRQHQEGQDHCIKTFHFLIGFLLG